MSIVNFEKARVVKEKFETELLKLENVVGVGIGLRKKDGIYTDEVALVVMVKKKVLEIELAQEDLIPQELEGVEVDVQEIGEVRADG
jgi:hypothetical protein